MRVAPDFWQRTVYVCGPNSFMQGVKTMLEGLDFPMENYYQESFGGRKKVKKQQLLPASTPPAPSPSVAHAPPPTPPVAKVTPVIPEPVVSKPAPAATSSCVVFAQSGKEVACDGEDSILDLAEQEGIDIESSCRSGVCGTCKALKLEGEVKYEGEPEALDETEQEEGYILTCIAHPVGRVAIDA